MNKQITISAFSEASGKTFKSVSIRPSDPLGWEFDEEKYISAIKSVLRYFIGKTIFFSEAKTDDELFDTLKRLNNIPSLESVTSAYQYKGDGRAVTTFMCKKNGDTDPVALMIKYSEK